MVPGTPLDQRLAYSLPEAAQVCGVGKNTLRTLIRSGRLVTVRLGAEGSKKPRLLVSRAALEHLLNAGPER